MKVTIGDKTYDWDGEYTFQEGVAIERITGMPLLDWLKRMDPKSRQKGEQVRVTDIGVVLWIVARRETPGLEFDDFDFPLDQWSMEDESGEPDPPMPVSGSLTGETSTKTPSPSTSTFDLGNGTD